MLKRRRSEKSKNSMYRVQQFAQHVSTRTPPRHVPLCHALAAFVALSRSGAGVNFGAHGSSATAEALAVTDYVTASTPLQYATKRGHAELVQVFQERGAL